MKNTKHKEGIIEREAMINHKRTEKKALASEKARLNQVRGKYRYSSGRTGSQISITISGKNVHEKFKQFCLDTNRDSSIFTVRKIN